MKPKMNPAAKEPSETDDGIVVDRPSSRIMRVWAKRIKSGKSKPVMVYVGGAWTMHVVRGNKRVMQVPIGDLYGPASPDKN